METIARVAIVYFVLIYLLSRLARFMYGSGFKRWQALFKGTENE